MEFTSIVAGPIIFFIDSDSGSADYSISHLGAAFSCLLPYPDGNRSGEVLGCFPDTMQMRLNR